MLIFKFLGTARRVAPLISELSLAAVMETEDGSQLNIPMPVVKTPEELQSWLLDAFTDKYPTATNISIDIHNTITVELP
jgi:hypothetical protein